MCVYYVADRISITGQNNKQIYKQHILRRGEPDRRLMLEIEQRNADIKREEIPGY